MGDCSLKMGEMVLSTARLVIFAYVLVTKARDITAKL